MNPRLQRSLAWRLDPVLMMRDAGFEPDAHQVELLTCADPQVLALWPRQSGKSQTCAVKFLHGSYFDPGDTVILAGEKQQQAQEVFEKAFDMHGRLMKLAEVPIVTRSGDELVFANNSRILAKPSTVESVRGYSAKRALIDEAAFTGDDTLAKIAPMLSATRGQLICATTPNGARGWFHDMWHNGDAAWRRLMVTVDRLPRLSAQELDRQRSLLTPLQFRQEFLLEWLDSNQQFFPTEVIRAARRSDIVPLFQRLREAA